MPTQTINFANVANASYNGTSLTEIKLNSTSIWQSKFSATMTVASASYQYCGSKNCSTETMYGFGGTAPVAPTLNGYSYSNFFDVIAQEFISNLGSMTSTSGGVISNTPIKGIFWSDPNGNGGRLSLWLEADFFANVVSQYNAPMYSFNIPGNTMGNPNIQAGSLQTLKIGSHSFDLQDIHRAVTSSYGTFTPANDGTNNNNYTKNNALPSYTYVDWDVSGNPFPSAGNTVTIEVT